MLTGHEWFIVPCLDWGWTPPQLVLGYWLAWSSWDNQKGSESHAKRLLFCWFPQILLFKKEYLLECEPQQWDYFTGSSDTCHCHVTVFLNNYTPFSFLTLKPERVIPSSRAGSRVFSFRRGWRRSGHANPLWAENRIRNQDFCLGRMQRGKKTTQMESNIIKM